ncbi:MAG: alanine racemase [Clostridia bacterium]|nr:alanine racemase [Clostridia bacterium]
MTKFVINKSDIKKNYEAVKESTDALVIPMLKADCYGLGAKAVMDLLQSECAVAVFAVSRLEEGLELSGDGREILLLSCYHDKESVQKAVDAGLTMAVDSLSQAQTIAEYAQSKDTVCSVHIKIDTGFGRFGFTPDSLDDIKAVFDVQGIKVTGIFSHFSAAFASESETDRQFEKFITVTDALKECGYDVGIRHIANSSATVRGKKYHLDAVRIGSLLLGRLPMAHDLKLYRVGRFETDIVDIRELKKGANIGYGNVFTLKRDTRVAVLCVGSADGILIKKDYDTYRVFDILRYGFGVFKMLLKDNRLSVTINGKRVKTVGRIALTHTMVDVTDIDCECGDKAIIDISPLYVADKVEREYI